MTTNPTAAPTGDAPRSSLRGDPADQTDVVLVAVAGVPDSERLLQGAATLARRSGATLLGVHVRTSSGGTPSTVAGEHRRLLAEQGGDYLELDGDDVADAVRQVARDVGATHVVLGSTGRPRWKDLAGRSILQRLEREGSFDVHVISRAEADPAPPASRFVPDASLHARRTRIAWLIAGLGLPSLVAVLLPWRSEHALPAVLLLFVLLTVAVASLGGTKPAVTVAVSSFFAVNWFLTPPYHTFVVGTAANLLGLVTFVVVGSVISFLVGQVGRRSAEAAKAQEEAEALAHAAGGLVGVRDPLTALAERLCAALELDGVAVLERNGTAWNVNAQAGAVAPASPEAATTTVSIGGDDLLALVGPELSEDDRRVLRAFAAQLTAALRQRRLQAEAAQAAALAEADRLRTALLRAVSHDLRTPLASIKANVSSLLQKDVDWPIDDQHAFLTTIELASDRLDHVIANLLDMGRLEAGVVQVFARPVSYEEIVPAALWSMNAANTANLAVLIDEHSPPVHADPTLLERAVANVISNALAWSRPEDRVEVTVDAVADKVELRVVDHGPGIPTAERDRIFHPFHRLGDHSNDSGDGLGLAVARGFVDAMNGRMHVEDTPGGGLTMVVSLPAATT